MISLDLDFMAKRIKRQVNNQILRENISFFESDSFKESLIAIYNSKTEEELKNEFDKLTDKILKNTNIKFNYDVPMIWDNCGMDRMRYEGPHGGPGTPSGYGSDTSFVSDYYRYEKNVKTVLSEVFAACWIERYRGFDMEEDTIWKHIVLLDGKKFPGDECQRISINTIGKIWLERMPIEKFRKLQIRTVEQDILPIPESQWWRKTINFSLSQTFPLMLYAMELAAKYNVELMKSGATGSSEKNMVYFDENELYQKIQIRFFSKTLAEHKIVLKGNEQEEYGTLNTTVKELIQLFEELVILRENVLAAKKELEEIMAYREQLKEQSEIAKSTEEEQIEESKGTPLKEKSFVERIKSAEETQEDREKREFEIICKELTDEEIQEHAKMLEEKSKIAEMSPKDYFVSIAMERFREDFKSAGMLRE